MPRNLIWLVVVLALAGCAPKDVTSGGQAATPVPYQTPTASLTPSLAPLETDILLPTPTAILYTVVAGDTLGAIAGRYGVTLQALLAANPGIQPAALTVGTSLLIPGESTQAGEPTPTPAVVPVRQARCWPESGGGLWCLAELQNDHAETLENLAVQFVLVDENGDEVASQAAYAPLDILPAGERMPLGVHFPAPLPGQVELRLQVLTAIRLLPNDVRYLPVMLENTLVEVQAGGRTARLTGRVLAGFSGGQASTLWIVAAAYDEDGNLVGYRRWEASTPLLAGESAGFDFNISSLGPEISSVEFLSEARP